MKLHYKTEKGQRKIRPYSIWANIHSRCYNPNSPNYKYYGEKGIRLCSEWLDKNKFIEWAYANGYQDNLTIERKKNDVDYCPENCYWATWEEQFLNRTGRIGISGFSGVSWHKPSQKWRSRITIKNKTISLGYFEDLNDAISARRAAEKEYWHKE